MEPYLSDSADYCTSASSFGSASNFVSTVTTTSMSTSMANSTATSTATSIPLMGGRPSDQEEFQQSGQSDVNRNSVPAACIACRTKHLKCNGQMPCSRCAPNALSALSCTYVRSRRGYRGPRRCTKQVPMATRQATVSCEPSSVGGQSTISSGSTGSVAGDSGPPQSDHDGQDVSSSLRKAPGHNRATTEVESCVAPRFPPATDHRKRCLEAFFRFFSQAHPFVLPKIYLAQMLRMKPLSHLEAAMRYVGSYYVKSMPTELIAQEVIQSLSRPDCVRDGFMVQAMLLLAIGLDGDTKFDQANDMLKQAQDLALELGMNHRGYAVMHGEGLAVLEESWRRTWWELYVVDGMIAGVHQQTSFRLNEMPVEVLLPCEEHEYTSGRIPQPHSLEEFEESAFADENLTFSSFAYRIAAIRNLGRVLQLQRVLFLDDPVVDQVDAHLVNWNLHLPESKRLAIDGDGQVDEMLFQAHMIITACTIMLHRPFSQLDTSVVREVTSCAPHRAVAPGHIYNIHAAKIIQSAESVSKLIMLPVPLIRHTHFFTCIITLASIVNLSYWAALLPLSYDENLKQQIRLNTGALKSLAEAWPSATRVTKQITGVAQEVFASRKLAASEGFWGTLTADEMLRSMIEDEGIISNFQLT